MPSMAGLWGLISGFISSIFLTVTPICNSLLKSMIQTSFYGAGPARKLLRPRHGIRLQNVVKAAFGSAPMAAWFFIRKSAESSIGSALGLEAALGRCGAVIPAWKCRPGQAG